MKTFPFGVLATLGILSVRAEASNYPPGYVVERTCQAQGPVDVCAVNHHYGNYPRINIYYKGYLLGAEGGINAWIQFNGRSGFYPLDLVKSDLYYRLLLNEPLAYFCWVGGVPDWYQGPYVGCRYPTHSEPEGSLVWEVNPIPQSETDLFFYARNQHGLANAWDIELAFVDSEGRWDSNSSQNFKFRFE